MSCAASTSERPVLSPEISEPVHPMIRRAAKVKAAVPRVPLRKAALSATAAARRPFPAWIDAAERAVAFPAVGVTPRIRNALVLRTVVAPRKSPNPKSLTDGPAAR